MRKAAFTGDDGIAIEIDDAFALRPMHGHHGVVAIESEVGDLTRARVGHARDHRVGGIEHGDAGVRLDVLYDDALDD